MLNPLKNRFFLVLILSIISIPSKSLSQSEVPVLAKAPGNPKVMLFLDDSGSMNAVIEHSDFNEDSSIVQNPNNDIPSIILRLESGSSAPSTSHNLRPILVEVNQRFSSSGTNAETLHTPKAFSDYANIPPIKHAGCINLSGSTVNCPSPGTATPNTGPNVFFLFGNTSVTGNSIFTLSNLAKSGSNNVTDSSGHEYLYINYRREDYNRNENWNDVWAKFDSNNNPLFYKTRVFSTTGGTVVFNNRQVFLSAGWYRIEYLRWIFYEATAQQRNNLPGTTRIQTVKNVVQNLILDNPSVSWGIATLNGTNQSTGARTGSLMNQWYRPLGNTSNNQPIIRRDIGSTNSQLLSSLNTIGAAGGTPLTNRYIEILRYFNGETSIDSNTNRTYPSPITGPTAACDSYFIVMLTDGLPTVESAKMVNGSHIIDYDGDQEELPDTSMAGCSSNVQCSKWLDDAAFFAYHHDFSPSVLGKQNIRSYAIGLGLNYNLLNRFAIAGGSSQSYLVNSVQEISDTLNNIVSLIITSPIAGAGAALAETFGETGIVYRPRFRADTWTGNIDVFKYNASNDTLEFSFDIAEILNQRDLSANPRKIIAGLDTNHDGRTNQTILFNSNNAVTLRPYIFKRFIDGIENTANLEDLISNINSVTSAETVIRFVHGEYIEGLRIRDRNQDGVLDRLGDIVYSRPVEVGHKNGIYNQMSGYVNFTRSLSNQPRILLVGSNDGMLHAFDSNSGQELWAYIPSSQIPHLERQTRMTYNAEFRRSYVDGPISVEDVYINGQWRTLAMFGLRKGGSTYTVLDITDRANPVLVWEVSNPEHYGESWTKPVVVPVGWGTSANNYNWYMVVGTGEGKTTAGTNLVIYNLNSVSPPTPTVLSISSSDPVGSRTGSVNASQTDQDLSVDRLYLGTEQGHLYRVNVQGDPSTWSVSRIYVGSNLRPIVAQPLTVIAENPRFIEGGSGIASERFAVGIYVGTGRYDTSDDITLMTTNQQAILGIFDPVRPDNDIYTNLVSNLTDSNLQTQSTSNFSATRDDSGIYKLANTRSGFLIPLANSINLVNNSYIEPVGLVQYEGVNLRGALFFSTFLPNTQACGVGGHSFLQTVNFRTGGGIVVDYSKNPKRPFFNGGIPDMDANSTLNQADLIEAYNRGIILPAVDAHVQSIDMTKVKPYIHDGKLKLNDIRLHSTNGGIMPAVSSLGDVGAPNPPVISQNFQKVIVQSAYPSGTNLGNAGSGSGGTGSGSGGSGSGSGDVPPPDMVPITIYNLPMQILSFHELTGD